VRRGEKGKGNGGEADGKVRRRKSGGGAERTEKVREEKLRKRQTSSNTKNSNIIVITQEGKGGARPGWKRQTDKKTLDGADIRKKKKTGHQPTARL